MGKSNAAGIFLINKENKVLVCHPTNHRDNLWSISKGKIEAGETDKAAALRETFEETNIDVSGYSLIHDLGKLVAKKNRTLHAYVIFEKENKFKFKDFDIKCNSKVPESVGDFFEMDDFKWLSLETAKRLLPLIQVEFLEMIEKML